MGLITKTPELVFGEGWTVGNLASPASGYGYLLFDTNLVAPINDLSDGFTASLFFYLPAAASTNGLRFLQTQYYDDLSGPFKNTAYGMFWTTVVSGSDTIFRITFREGGIAAPHINQYVATVVTSDITLGGWNHIIMGNDGSTTTKAYFNDSSVSASKSGTLTTITTDNTHDLIQGGVYSTPSTIGGTALGHGFQNIYFGKGYDDLDTASNRRHFLKANGTPADGVPNPPSNSDPEVFLSGTHTTVDHYENPGNTGVSHTVTRTNLTLGPRKNIKVF